MSRFKRAAIAAAVTAAVIGLCVFAWGAGQTPGTSGDPVVTLDWMTNVLAPDIQNQGQSKIAAGFDPLYSGMKTKVKAARLSAAARTAGFLPIDKIAAKITLKQSNSPVAFTVGQTVTIQPGGTIVLLSGGARGSDGTSLKPYTKLFLPDGGKFTLTAAGDAQIAGLFSVEQPYKPRYTAMADALKALGMFQGTGNGYELDKVSYRVDAIVMLCRMMGKEKEALAYTGSHPFTDVPSWATRYVAYAYSKGWAQGQGGTTFGSNNLINAGDYLTLTLRSMGYSSDKDFNWARSIEFAQTIKLLTASEAATITNTSFRRDYMAMVSYKRVTHK
ncbi:hypothetical protein FACS1894217_09670 [Clostridia bacterium]|nr:hypothetical protein FACS1894217_09670 [Clostridia bacterium]